jgi:iron(III) transport system substrate-binding protein
MTKYLRLVPALLVSLAAGPAFAQSGEVNVYSYREPGLIQPLLDKFTAETGIKTNVLFAGDGLLERVAAEGELSPADVVLTVDIGNLANAKDFGITQTIPAEAQARVPAAYQDPDGQWIALSLRARVFYASKDRVPETALTYEDIAKPEWKGRLCTRSGQHVYNIGLIATRIAHWGVDKTRDWLTKVRDNLNGPVSGADRDQVKKILDGSCDLAIGNTYYMGLMLNNDAEPEQKTWAAAARIIYPDPDGDGTQVNVSGRGHRQVRAQPGQRPEAGGIPALRRSPAPLCQRQLRIPRRRRRRPVRPRRQLGRAQGRQDAAHRDRGPSQAGQRAGRRTAL